MARIDLETEELERLSGQLADILEFIDKLKKLNVENIAPTSHILPLNNILRQDTPQASLPCDKALDNAPDRQGKFFGVPKVIDQE